MRPTSPPPAVTFVGDCPCWWTALWQSQQTGTGATRTVLLRCGCMVQHPAVDDVQGVPA